MNKRTNNLTIKDIRITRENINKQIRGMTNKEIINFFSNSTKNIKKKYNFIHD
jgi:rRNA processing protein Krr1/Pno1